MQVVLQVEVDGAQQNLPRYGAARATPIVLLLVRYAFCEYLLPQPLNGRVVCISGGRLLRTQDAVDPWQSHVDPRALGVHPPSIGENEKGLLPAKSCKWLR